MAQQAYLCLTDENDWALASSDGGEEIILVVGRPFTPGADIRAAVAELEAWAAEQGYVLTTPPAATASDIALEDLIEPEIFDEVFGDEGAS